MYAVLHPPNFAAQVAAQQRPELRKRPFALIDGEPPTDFVFAANKAARLLGVEVGMTRLQGESFPEVVVVPRMHGEEVSAQTILHTITCMFSPRIEYVETHPGTYVLDMSDVLPQHIMRIPLATWYRFRLAAEQARTALIFLSQSPCASSCAALSLSCEPAKTRPFSASGETALFEGQQYTLVRERNRNEGSPLLSKKPPAQAEWCAESLWARVR